jgi:hypothetical protein
LFVPATIQSLGFHPDLACGEVRDELTVVELSKLAELLDQATMKAVQGRSVYAERFLEILAPNLRFADYAFTDASVVSLATSSDRPQRPVKEST